MAMHLWHSTQDAPRVPSRGSAGERLHLSIGSWPVEPGQSVWVLFTAERVGRRPDRGRVEAVWQRNERGNSYWEAVIGPFETGTSVSYTLYGEDGQGQIQGASYRLRVGPKIHLALLWHQHQPIYKDLSGLDPKGSYTQPWVRLHAIRDYYAMANLLAQYPGVHLTINLTPCLLWQIEDYAKGGATDLALDLTLKAVERLTNDESEKILSSFFDADWHNQIFPHSRYKELFEKRHARGPFSTQDLRDLQMWFNLAWFAGEFREGEVRLTTGETVSVLRLVEKGRNFSIEDIHEMVEQQYKIMRAVIPTHRELQKTCIEDCDFRFPPHWINTSPHSMTWTFTNQIARVQPGDRVTVQTNCPGVRTWQIDAEPPGNAPLLPVGGVMAGVHRYNLTLGPFSTAQKELAFSFHCTHKNCDCGDVCCEPQRFMMQIRW